MMASKTSNTSSTRSEVLVVDHDPQLYPRYRNLVPESRQVHFADSVVAALDIIRSHPAIQTLVVEGWSRCTGRMEYGNYANTILLLKALELFGFAGSAFVVCNGLDAVSKLRVREATSLLVRLLDTERFFADSPPWGNRKLYWSAAGKLRDKHDTQIDSPSFNQRDEALRIGEFLDKLEGFEEILELRNPAAALVHLVGLGLFLPDQPFRKGCRIFYPDYSPVFHRAAWEAMRPHPFLLEMIRLELVDDLAGPHYFREDKYGRRVAYGRVVARTYGRMLLRYVLRVNGPDERVVSPSASSNRHMVAARSKFERAATREALLGRPLWRAAFLRGCELLGSALA
jgi:hypothetical protein